MAYGVEVPTIDPAVRAEIDSLLEQYGASNFDFFKYSVARPVIGAIATASRYIGDKQFADEITTVPPEYISRLEKAQSVGNQEYWVNLTGEMAGTLAIIYLSRYLGGAAAAPLIGTRIGPMATALGTRFLPIAGLAASAAESTYHAIKEWGRMNGEEVDDDVANQYARLNGLLSGGLAYVAGSKILAGLAPSVKEKLVAKVASSFLHGAGEQAGLAAAQQLFANGAVNQAIRAHNAVNPDHQIPVPSLFDGESLVQAAFTGGLIGGLMKVPFSFNWFRNADLKPNQVINTPARQKFLSSPAMRNFRSAYGEIATEKIDAMVEKYEQEFQLPKGKGYDVLNVHFSPEIERFTNLPFRKLILDDTSFVDNLNTYSDLKAELLRRGIPENVFEDAGLGDAILAAGKTRKAVKQLLTSGVASVEADNGLTKYVIMPYAGKPTAVLGYVNNDRLTLLNIPKGFINSGAFDRLAISVKGTVDEIALASMRDKPGPMVESVQSVINVNDYLNKAERMTMLFGAGTVAGKKATPLVSLIPEELIKKFGRTRQEMTLAASKFLEQGSTGEEALDNAFSDLFGLKVQSGPSVVGNFIDKFLMPLGMYIDKSMAFGRSITGQKFAAALDKYDFKVRTFMGKYMPTVEYLQKYMPDEDVKFLQEYDAQGIPNIQKLIEGGMPPKTQGQRLFLQHYEQLRKALGQEAEGVRVLTKFPKGLAPFETPEKPHLFRYYTNAAKEFIFDSPNSKWAKLLEQKILDLNPGFKSVDLVRNILQQEAKIRKSQVLEFSRRIPNMPYFITDDEGHTLQVLETDPFVIMSRAVQEHARRISFISMFGHSQGIPEPTRRQILESLKVLKVDPYKEMEKLVFASEPALSYLNVRQDIIRKNFKDWFGELNLNELLIREIQNADISTLKKVALKLRHVLPSDDPVVLRERIIRRIYDKPYVDKLNEWRLKLLDKVGPANLRIIDRIVAEAQGIPQVSSIEGTLPYKIWRPISNFYSWSLTSLSSLSNVAQSMHAILYTDLGSYAKGFGLMLRNYGLMRDQAIADGVFGPKYTPAITGKNLSFEEVARWLRKVGDKTTFLSAIAELDNVASYAAAREYWDKLVKYGPKDEDLVRFKKLRLPPNFESMIGTEEGRRLFVQRVVDESQYLTKASHRQGEVVHGPLIKELIPFMQYSIETLKTTNFLINEIMEAKNAERAVTATKLLMKHATILGIEGLITRALWDIVSGRTKPDTDKKSIIEKALDAVMQAQIFGPTTRILMYASEGDSIQDYLINLMPKVRAIAEGISVGLNALGARFGKYAELPIADQILNYGKSVMPLFRVGHNRVMDVIYPERKKHIRVRQAVFDFMDKQGIKPEAGGDAPINPAYYAIAKAIEAGQLDKAQEEAARYYANGGSPERVYASLYARRPLNMPEKWLPVFLTQSEVAGEAIELNKQWLEAARMLAGKEEKWIKLPTYHSKAFEKGSSGKASRLLPQGMPGL